MPGPSPESKNYAATIDQVRLALLPFQLKGRFYESTPPSRDLLAAAPDAFGALHERFWNQMTPADGAHFIRMIEFLSDAEFVSAFPLMVDYLLSASEWTPSAEHFVHHLRDVSKNHVHRNFHYAAYSPLLLAIDALQEKFAPLLAKKQETSSHLRKARQWAQMHVYAKR